MNTVQQTPTTSIQPNGAVSAAPTTLPPVTHTPPQAPQNFALPTAPAVQSSVVTEAVPQMQTLSPIMETAPAAAPVITQPPMPEMSAVPPVPPASFVPPAKKGLSFKTLIAVVIMFVTIIGGGAAYYLSTQSQDIRQQAYDPGKICTTNGGKTDTGVLCSSLGESQCAVHAGSGCSWDGASKCFCGSGGSSSGGSNIISKTCGNSPQICNTGTADGKIAVSECREDGYTGNECRIGCGSHQVNVPAGGCVGVGITKPACGRWQVDVKNSQTGQILCSDFSCEGSGCGGTTPTTPTTSTPPTAEISLGAANCLNTGKYTEGQTVTFNVKATTGEPKSTEVAVFIGVLDAAGTALTQIGPVGSSCLGTAGTIAGPAGTNGYYCKIQSSDMPMNGFTGSVYWQKPIAGKYVVVVNAGASNGISCSGNPRCTYSTDSDFAKVDCGSGFVNCSSNDWHKFEVVPAAQCSTTPTATPSYKIYKCGQTYPNNEVGSTCEALTTTIDGPNNTMICAKSEYITACKTRASNPNGAGTLADACCKAPVVTTAPMCMNITAKTESGTVLTKDSKLRVGDKVNFTCGSVAGISYYQFKVTVDGQAPTTEFVKGPVSKLYTVTKPLPLDAECTICRGTTQDTCYSFGK